VSATLLLAHDEGGLGGAGLSPSLVLYGSVAMLVLVAVALRSTWTTSRLGPMEEAAGDVDARRVGGPVVAGRAVALALLALLLLIGFTGSPTPGANLVPVAVYSAFWYGGLLVSVLAGDVWRAVNPAVTIVEALDRARGRAVEPSPAPARSVVGADASVGAGTGPIAPQPYGIGLVGDPGDDDGDGGVLDDDPTWWIPAALLLAFSVLWICWPGGVRPRPTTTFLVVWLATMVGGGAVHGPGWVRRHDPFAVLFSAVAACSPVRWPGGRPSPVSPVRHLASRVRAPGDVVVGVVLAIALGATIFDGVRVTRTWTDLVGPRSLTSLGVMNTVGLAWIILTVVAVWMLVARAMDRSAGDGDPLPTAVAFAPALAVVVVAVRLAHGLERFLVAGQNLVSLASDPFANGADLLGTVDWVDHPILSATVLAWVGLILLLAGHLTALVVLHDRSVARFGAGVAARTVWPVTACLVVSLVVALRLFGL
jgi:hypothetical protein